MKPSDRIYDIKNKINDEIGVSPENQILILIANCKRLENYLLVSDYEINSGCKMVLTTTHCK